MKKLAFLISVLAIPFLLLAQPKDQPPYMESRNGGGTTVKENSSPDSSKTFSGKKKDYPILRIGARPEDVYRQLMPGEISFKSDRMELVNTRDSLGHTITGWLMPGEVMITDTATFASGHIRKFDIAQCGNFTYPVRKDGKSLAELDMRHLTPFAVYVSRIKEPSGKIVETIRLVPDTLFRMEILARLERIESILTKEPKDTFWDTAWPWVIGGVLVAGTTYAIASNQGETTIINNPPPNNDGSSSGWVPPGDPPPAKIGFNILKLLSLF